MCSCGRRVLRVGRTSRRRAGRHLDWPRRASLRVASTRAYYFASCCPSWSQARACACVCAARGKRSRAATQEPGPIRRCARRAHGHRRRVPMRVSPHPSGIATKIGGNEFEIDALRRAAGMARKHVDAYLARGRPLLLARRARHDEAAQTQLEVFVDSSTPSCERVGVGAGENKIRQRLPHRRHCRRFLCQERCRAIRLRRAVEAHALRWRRCAPGDALCPRHGRQHGRHKQRQKQRNYHRWRDPLRHPRRGAGRATPASPAPPPSRLARRAAPRASVRTAHARCGEAVRAAQPARARAPPCRRRRQYADAFLISSCQRMRCVGIEFDSRRENLRPALSPPSQQPLSKGRGALAFPLRFGAP